MLNRKLVSEKEWRDTTRHLQLLTDTVTHATQFIREIEKGNLDVTLESDGMDSELNASLISMRDQMKNFSLAEQERSWVNEGLAKFVEILRSRNNDTLKRLSDSILQSLVTYLKANQGALFLVNDDDPKNTFLEMMACYAYDRKKYLEKTLSLGEGITGQAVLEKGTIYMTDIPKDFIKITSGLGEAVPRNILVVPLKLDDKVYGVVEIASFNLIKGYQIEFVEKLGESIASTIAGVRANDRTKALLQETQSQAEEMRSQEEEMRQNMEELSSTQEEMQRILNEVQNHERFTKGILDSSSDMIVTIDRKYKVTNFNKALYENFKQVGFHVENGFDITNLVKPEDRARHIEKYEEAFSGKQVSLQEHYVFEGMDQFIVFVFTPIRNEKNEIHAVSIFAKDITEITRIKNKIEESEKYLSDLLNVSTDPTMTIDRDYKLVLFNKHYQDSFTRMGIPIAVGFNVLDIFGDEAAIAEKKKLYDRVFKGEVVEVTEHLTTGGLDHYYQTKHAPIYDSHGKINTIAIIAKDVTEVTKARNVAQQQNEELKAQEEELRQNMEELSSTQEEMNRVLLEVQRNEAFVTGLINASNDSIITLDKNLCILNFNEAFKAAYHGQDIVIEKGLPIRKLVAAEDADRYEAAYKRAFNGETFSATEHYNFGGIAKYFDINYVPLRDAEDKVYAIAIFTSDITNLMVAKQKAEELLHESQQQTEELKAQEEELRQNMEELAATQEAINQQYIESEKVRQQLEVREMVLGITTILSESDLYGTITYVNDKLCEVSQYSREELIGQPHSIFRHPDMPKELFKKLWNALKAGKTFRAVVKNKKKDGTHYWVDATFMPVRNEEGKVYKYISSRYHIENDKYAADLFEKQFARERQVVA